MKSKLCLNSFVMSVLLGAVIVLSVGAVANGRKSWEYKTAYNLNNEELNKLGDEGWELAGYCFTPATPNRSSDYIRYVFKRAN